MLLITKIVTLSCAPQHVMNSIAHNNHDDDHSITTRFIAIQATPTTDRLCDGMSADCNFTAIPPQYQSKPPVRCPDLPRALHTHGCAPHALFSPPFMGTARLTHASACVLPPPALGTGYFGPCVSKRLSVRPRRDSDATSDSLFGHPLRPYGMLSRHPPTTDTHAHTHT